MKKKWLKFQLSMDYVNRTKNCINLCMLKFYLKITKLWVKRIHKNNWKLSKHLSQTQQSIFLTLWKIKVEFRNPNVSASCKDLITRMLRKKPVDRPRNSQVSNHEWMKGDLQWLLVGMLDFEQLDWFCKTWFWLKSVNLKVFF